MRRSFLHCVVFSLRYRPGCQVRLASGPGRGLPGRALHNVVECPVWPTGCYNAPAQALTPALVNPTGPERAETARRVAGCTPRPRAVWRRAAAATCRPPGRQKGEERVDAFRIVAWARPRGFSLPSNFRRCHPPGHLTGSLHHFASHLPPTPPFSASLLPTAHVRVSRSPAGARRRPSGRRVPACRPQKHESPGVGSSWRAG